MKKYLYIYNYAPNEQSLCELEHEYFFHDKLNTKYYFSDEDVDYTRSVFIKARINLLYTSTRIETIGDELNYDQLYYLNFKVEYMKNDITHVDYKEAINWCRMCAYPIDGSVNMQNPETTFVITKIEEDFYFGIIHYNREWHKHEDKPYSYSHSLPLRISRTLLNLGSMNPKAKFIDPCCGIGTVVLEGLSMGLDIVGSDINRDVSYQARMNLIHYGYNPAKITKKDIHDIIEQYDVAIIDIPYGVYSEFTLEDQINLLSAVKNFTKRLILVTHIDMNSQLTKLGFTIENQCIYQKASFKRYITIGKLR